MRGSQVLLLLAFLGTAEAAENSLCDSPKVQPKEECQSTRRLYRDHGVISHIEVARVLAGWSDDDDTLEPRYTYFLRMPDGRIVRPKNIPSHRDLPLLTMRRLGIRHQQIDPSLIYDEVIESIGRRHCLVRIARPPFSGEEVQCSDHEDLKSFIDYMPGTITVEAARYRVCQTLGYETPASCNALRGSGVFLRRVTSGGEGVLSYEIGFRIRLGEQLVSSTQTVSGMEPAPEYEEGTYTVSSDTGAVTLVSKAKVRCIRNVCEPIAQDP